MTLLILMQRPKQEGLGAAFGGGVTDQVFGARTTNVLQRGTVYLGSMFFVLALTLAVLYGIKNKHKGLADLPAPAEKVEEAPVKKVQEELKPKSLSEELPVESNVPKETAPAPTVPAETPAKESPDKP
jgi:preprotein translocase subunit SecG